MQKKKYIEKKIELLEKLTRNLETEENCLLDGDPDHALEWESENQKVLSKLMEWDRKWEDYQLEHPEDPLPAQESEILLSSTMYGLIEEASLIQARVQKLLESERDTARNELNEVAVKRQLKLQLSHPDGLFWKKRIC